MKKQEQVLSMSQAQELINLGFEIVSTMNIIEIIDILPEKVGIEEFELTINKSRVRYFNEFLNDSVFETVAESGLLRDAIFDTLKWCIEKNCINKEFFTYALTFDNKIITSKEQLARYYVNNLDDTRWGWSKVRVFNKNYKLIKVYSSFENIDNYKVLESAFEESQNNLGLK